MIARTGRPEVLRPVAYYDELVLLTELRAQTWLELPTVPYGFRDTADRRQLGMLSTMALAKLGEGPVHIKVRHVDTVATETGGWRRARTAHAERYGQPTVGFEPHMVGAERRMLTVQPFTKQVFLGYGLGRRSALAQLRDRLAPTDDDINARELARWHAAAETARSTLGRGALSARPLGAEELRQLRRRSVWRGLTPPPMSATGRTVWGRSLVADEFEGVELSPVLFGTAKGPRSAVAVDSPHGRVFTATLVAAAFPLRMEFPRTRPWLAHVDGLPFPVEVDALLDLVPPRVARSRFGRRLDLARDQDREAAKAGAELPVETELMIDLAREWEHKIPTRRLPMVWGHVTFRVDADSLEELASRCAVLTEHYQELGIDLAWPSGASQRGLLLQAVPGAERQFRSFRQVWPVETVGCGLPTAASNLGHPTGMYCGPTTGRQVKAVTFDLHWAIRRSVEQGERHVEAQGGVVLLGNPRAGKSGALGTMVHDGALWRMPQVVIDFGGQLARLAQVPDIAGQVRVVDLLQAGAGSADPMGPAIVPGDGATDRVRAARERLTFETLRTLAWRQVDTDAGTRTELQQAIQRVSRSSEPSTAAVLDALLHSEQPAGRNLGAALAFDLDTDEGSVLTGEGAALPAGLDGRSCTVLTGRGIVLPEPGKPLAAWDPAELFGAATFGIVAVKAQQLLWELPPGTLSALMIDEAHVPLATPAGRRVISSALRNGPKQGVATVLATHNAEEVSADWLANMVSTWMLFRTTAPGALGRALEVMSVEGSADTRELVRGFRNGECLMLLPGGERDRMRWDQWRADLAAALKTTAGEVA